MKIEKLQITMEPSEMFNGAVALRVRTWADGKTHEVARVVEIDHFGSLFEQMMDEAKEMMKRTITEGA